MRSCLKSGERYEVKNVEYLYLKRLKTKSNVDRCMSSKSVLLPYHMNPDLSIYYRF